MSDISLYLPSPPDNFSTTLSSSINTSALTIPLNSVSGLGTEGVGVLFKKDSNGDVIAGSVEFIHWTNVSGSNLTLSDVADRGLTGSDAGAQSYTAGDYFEVWVSSYYYASQRDGFLVEHEQDGEHGPAFHALAEKTTPVDADEIGIIDSVASYVLKRLTWAKMKIALWTGFQPPQGFLINGKISVTDAAGITVAIKTLAGTDPSATDPVWVRIGDTMRAITSALSVAKADGTNWCNAGSSELATKEIDYFVYLGYNATDGVVIGFSRYPGANSYDDFSATSTNEKYCAISTITNAAATDYYEVVGRFSATLSAGAGYTWSVPTYTAKNLIQRPIYETRQLTWVPTWTGFSSNPTGDFYYKIIGRRLFVDTEVTSTGTSNSTSLAHTIPFSSKNARLFCTGFGQNNSASLATVPRLEVTVGSSTLTWSVDGSGTLWTASGSKAVRFSANFEI